jgi:hypothetical protein
MVLKYGRNLHYDSIDSIIEEFNKDNIFQSSMRNANWILPDEIYPYRGTGKRSVTEMGTFVFYKKILS